MAVGIRFVGALVVVLATYNPSGHSFYHWASQAVEAGTAGPEHAFVGVVLASGWAVLVIATVRSLGWIGLTLACAFFGTLVWWLSDAGVLPTGSVSAVQWIALVCLAGVLSLGVAWGHLWRRITGRVEVDEAEDR
jgi:hypothetical protein